MAESDRLPGGFESRTYPTLNAWRRAIDREALAGRSFQATHTLRQRPNGLWESTYTIDFEPELEAPERDHDRVHDPDPGADPLST